MGEDIKNYVQVYVVCVQLKSSNQPLSGELQPLPVLRKPWSHIALDFVTGLPESSGGNTISTTVDRFFLALYLIALAGLLTVKTTMEIIIEHVVRLLGFSKDIILGAICKMLYH